MSEFKKVLTQWAKGQAEPVYWLEGEEDFYIDELVKYAENKLLTEEEAAFNQTIFYGRDADWASVINACRRYPVQAARQVVLLKEAQQMRDIDKLEPYLTSPMPSTIFVVGYKGKLDKRLKLTKTIADKAVLVKSEKVRDEKLPEWINNYVAGKGLKIGAKSVSLLAEQIGSDLSRLANEIEKLGINLGEKDTIDEDDIEKYIGISKEYNSFELLAAICKRDLAKAIKILNYFEANPKANPIQLVLPALYGHFSKMYVVHTMKDKSEFALKPLFYYNPISVQQAKDSLRNFDFAATEKILLLLHHYNLKSVGINVNDSSNAALLKEMIVKISML